MKELISPVNISFQEKLEASGLFHKCYTNNYTFEFVSRKIDLVALVEERKNSLKVLNQGSYDLYLFCIQCLAEIKATGQLDNEKAFRVNTVLKNWRNLLHGGNSFATYDYAQEVVKVIHQFGFPFIEKLYLQKNKKILDTFNGVLTKYKYFVKIACYGDEVDLEIYLSRLLEILQHIEILDAIERVEVARTDFPLCIKNGEGYPLFSITFDYLKINCPDHPLVIKLIDLFGSPVETSSNFARNISYSKEVSANLTLSQGFKNYKKYLGLLNILDKAYDRRDGYAFQIYQN